MCYSMTQVIFTIHLKMQVERYETQFRVNVFNLGMYTVKMALSCRNMSE